MRRALIVATVSGFVPQFEMNNVKILQELGYEVHYASNFSHPHYGSDNHRLDGSGIICHQVDFVRSPFRIMDNARAFRQLCRLLEQLPFEMIHCHTPMGGVLGRLAAERIRRRRERRQCRQGSHREQKVGWKTALQRAAGPAAMQEEAANAPELAAALEESEAFADLKSNNFPAARVIYTAHGFHFYKGAPLMNWIFYYPVERWLARITDTLITINEEDYRRAKKFHLRRQGSAEKVNGVGIDTSACRILPVDREKKRGELGVADEAFFAVSVGELNRNKNHGTVLKALAKIPDQRIYYGICGKGSQSRYLEKQIHELGLNNAVLYGYREDIPEVLKAADVFIFPSLREGLGLAALEALACGIPVIAYENRGTKEYMRDGENGYVVKKNEPDGFGAAIQKIHELPRQEYENMKLQARLSAQRFGLQETGKKMKQIYIHSGIRAENFQQTEEGRENAGETG